MIFFNPTEEFVNKLVEVIADRFVIEIGCGEGHLLKALLDKGVKAMGIDPFVDSSHLVPGINNNFLPWDHSKLLENIDNLEKNSGKIVFLVARPCHSAFTQDYLNFFCDHREMIYIGFVKNLEIDFQRELSLVRFIKFPDHPDCNCVAVLTNGLFDQNIKKAQDWDKVDRKVAENKGKVDEKLINWFLSNRVRSTYNLLKEKISEKFPNNEIGGGHYGGNWNEYEDWKLLSRDLTGYRMVTLEISTFLVGGGHFSCRFEVEDEEFWKIVDDKVAICSPWDKDELRPAKFDLYKKDHSYNYLWYGFTDHKRVSNLEAGMQWLKNTFLQTQTLFKKEYNLDIYFELGSGLRFEIEEYTGKEVKL